MSEDALDPLVTQCPNCDTRFRVTEQQLRVASGRVRCGACLTVFEGTSYLLIDGEPLASGDSEDDVDALLDEIASSPEKADLHDASEASQDDAASPSEHADLDALEADLMAELRGEPTPTAANVSDVAEEKQQESLKEITVEASEEPSIQSAEPKESDDLDKDDADKDDADKDDSDGDDSDKNESSAWSDDIVEDAWSESADAEGELEGQGEHKAGQPPQLQVTETSISPEPRRPNVPDESAAVASLSLPSPSLLEDDANLQAPRQRVWVSWLLLFLGLVALPAQVLWFQFDSWGKDDAFRPLYAQICGVVGCELPIKHDVSLISAKDAVLRDHPDRDDALIYDALLINNADFPQPFPIIELILTSLNGNLVAGRRFQPGEYLRGEVVAQQMMQPRTPVHISIQMQDPGEDSLNYRVVFR
ncbi:MAG: DUF3426 domain-containing protein [Gammaproteobacteria bacterium]|nr:DUF3426 domain-containing protein [Gammaproteobacteria bacterium]